MYNSSPSLRQAATILAIITATVLLTIVGLTRSSSTLASSHREAPLIAQDPSADTTDVYAFIPKGQTGRIALIANWIPYELPESGPKYYEFSDQVIYEIFVDNNGDAKPDVTYTLRSNTTVRDPNNTFLYNTGPIHSIHDTTWNRPQRYTLTETRNGHSTVLLNNVMAPPVNIGGKSTPNYQALVNEATYQATGGIKVYAGPADDPFYADLQIFDLLTLRGQGSANGYESGNNAPTDSISGYNVHTLALEIPIDRLTRGNEPVLGVWAGSRRMGMSVNNTNNASVQVSRLGMPLVNSAMMPWSMKDTFNSVQPAADMGLYSSMQNSIENPELGTLICNIYDVPLPGDSNHDCKTEYRFVGATNNLNNARSGRGDIFDIFLTGMTLANPLTINTAQGQQTLPTGFNFNRPANVVPAEMIRVNTTISGELCAPTPSRLGVLGGDACGFPNGRRLMDDVIEIELLAIAGAAYRALDGRDSSFAFDNSLVRTLNDGVHTNDVRFSSQFPYLALAHSGQEHVHTEHAPPAHGNAIPGTQVSARLKDTRTGADSGYSTFTATEKGTQFVVNIQIAKLGTDTFEVVLYDMPDCTGRQTILTQIKTNGGKAYKTWHSKTDLNDIVADNGAGLGIKKGGITLLCAAFYP